MAFRFLGLGRGSDSHEPVGAIAATAAVPVDVEHQRITRLAAQMQAAGVGRVVISADPGLPAAVGAGLPRVPPHKLTRTHRRAPIVYAASSQYHLQAAHVRRLLLEAGRHSQCVQYRGADAPCLNSMGLNFRSAVLYPGAYDPRGLRLSETTFGSTGSLFGDGCRAADLPVEDADLQEAYRAFSETTTPHTAVIELNSTCNFKCGYCPFHGDDPRHPHYVQPGQGHEMTVEDFDALVGQVAAWRTPYEHHVKTIAPFWSGEFFLAQNWEAALRVVRKHKQHPYVCSNASVLSDEIIDKVTSNDYLHHLSISLEATSHETNLEIRKNKKYDQIVATIERLIERRRRLGLKMRLALNFTLVEANAALVEEYVRRWSDRVDYILLGPRYRLPPGQSQGVFDAWPTELARQLSSRPTRRLPCTYLLTMVTVDCHQNLQLCSPCGARRYNVGNVKGRNIAEVQRLSPLYQDVLAMQRDGTWREFPYCETCTMDQCHFGKHGQVLGHAAYATPAAWTIYPKGQPAVLPEAA
jgi:hypothetical protein